MEAAGSRRTRREHKDYGADAPASSPVVGKDGLAQPLHDQASGAPPISSPGESEQIGATRPLAHTHSFSSAQ